MSDAIVEIVRNGDAERFLSVMAAPPDMRLRLFTLYAFNVEVSRAPWASNEELIAEMRLQWWRDAIEAVALGKAIDTHEVILPLTEVIQAHALPVALFDQMVTARRWDIYRDPFRDAANFERYIDQTSGNLMWLAALSVGVGHASEHAVRDYAYGVGVANWLLAVPELVARGRLPLVDGSNEGIMRLARGALARMAQADRALLKPAAPVLRSGWQARGILSRAMKSPERVGVGHLRGSEFSRRGGLLIKSVTGRW